MNAEIIALAAVSLIAVAVIVWRVCTAPLGWEDADGWHAGEEPDWLGIGGGDDRFHDERNGL